MSAHSRTSPAAFPAFRLRRKAAAAEAAQLDAAPANTFLVGDPDVLAARSAEGQHDRHGEPLARHLERVADAVPQDARRVALLHEALQRRTTNIDELTFAGLSPVEIAALRVLTRGPDESFELHVLTIAHAPGPEGRVARLVAAADIDDHLAHRTERHPASDTPPYSWARRHLEIALARTAEPELAQHP
jgi:hypothetical protein